jgi:hypothetical protein
MSLTPPKVADPSDITTSRNHRGAIARPLSNADDRRKAMNLSDKQRKEIESLWFLYGNYGANHSDRDHRFLQSLLESGRDLRALFKPSSKVVAEVDRILSGAPSAPSLNP